jgi:excisionase family DNA binding protein
LGVSPCTVYRWVESREIPHLKRQGLGVRFKPEEIEAWLKKNEAKPACQTANPNLPLTLPPEHTIKKSHGQTGGTSEMPKGKFKSRRNFGFGAVYVRKTSSGNPRYYLDYFENGKRIQRVCRRAASFEDAYFELRQAVFKEPEKKRSTFSAFADEYLEDYAKPTKKSWKADKVRLGKLKKYFKEMDLRQITPMEIERFRSSLLSKGKQKSTTNRYLALLKRMFNLAIEEGYMEGNPARKVKMFSEAENLKERILTDGEERLLLDGCCEHMRDLVTFALNTGMRLGEILNLKWANVDMKSGTIKVEFTKSGKTRIVPMNQALREMLARPRKRGEVYVFTNPDSKDRFRETKTSFKTGCRKAGIEGLRFHDLRHTFASRLVRNGVDIGTVRKLLGHSTLLITQRYVHSDESMLRSAVGSLVRSGNLLHPCDMDGREKFGPEIPTPVNTPESVN